MDPRRRSAWLALRVASLGIAIALGGLGCDPEPIRPMPGQSQWRAPALVPVPGALLDAVSGNLLLSRRDLSIDTRLGTYVLGAVWNSADRRWHFGFEASYRDGIFVDESGARADVGALAPGAAVPGTRWVKLDAHRMKTKGGRVHDFALDGAIESIHFEGHPHPRLDFERGMVAGETRIHSVRQCSAPGACETVLTLEWDADARLAGAVDRAGRCVAYTWLAEGRLASARDARACETGAAATQFEYAGGDLVAWESAEAERVEYHFDGKGRMLEARAVGEGDLLFQASYERTAGRNASRLEGPGGSLREWIAEADGRVLELREPAGIGATLFSWQGRRIVQEVSPAGVVTRYAIEDDDVVSIQRGDLPARTVRYAAGAIEPRDPERRPVLEVRDGLGLVVARTYGADGLAADETNGAGETTTWTWQGPTLVAATGPDGREVRFLEHGEHGHAARVERGGAVFAWYYDAVGNRLRGERNGVAIAPGGEVERRFDAGRALVEIAMQATHPGVPAQTTRSVRIERRSDGQVRAIRRPGGLDLEYAYDALGRLVERRQRRTGGDAVEWLRYGPQGGLFERELSNGMRTRQDVDAAGRPVLVSHWRGTALEQAALFAYQGERLVGVGDSVLLGSESIEYDAVGRPVRIQHAGGERREIDYDERSLPVRESYWLDEAEPLVVIERRFDGAGRLRELSRDGSRRVGFEREGGRLARILHGPGDPAVLTRHLERDPLTALLTGSVLLDANGAQVASSQVSWVQDLPSTTTVTAATHSARGIVATSEESHRLYGLGLSGPSGPRLVAHGLFEFPPLFFDYDEVANWTNDGLIHSAQYDAERSRLLSVRDAWGAAVHHFAWDAAGFATARDGEVVEHDAAGRVTRVGDAARFVWDVRGRPVERELSGVTRRLRFGGRVACDEEGVPLSLDLGHVSIRFDGQGDRHRHFDYRGNVTLVTDDAGSVVSHVAYAPYGVAAVHGEVPERSFAGGLDLGGELVLLGHRVLDGSVGRFLSPDPVPQLVNEYAYAQGNPILYSDPTGATFESVLEEYGGVAGSAAGAAVGAGAALAYLNVAAVGPASAAAAAGGAVVGYWAGTRVGGFVGRTLDDLLGDPAPPASSPGSSAPAPPAVPSGPTPTPPGRSDAGRAKGCVGACVGGPRFHGPGLSLSDSAVTAPSCAGPRFGEAPDLRGWLPLLLPLCVVLTLACGRPWRGSGG